MLIIPCLALIKLKFANIVTALAYTVCLVLRRDFFGQPIAVLYRGLYVPDTRWQKKSEKLAIPRLSVALASYYNTGAIYVVGRRVTFSRRSDSEQYYPRRT
jgi:hypothetical protein